MPYIKPEDRARMDGGANPETPGELSYVITRNTLYAMKLHGKKEYAWFAQQIGGQLRVLVHELIRQEREALNAPPWEAPTGPPDAEAGARFLTMLHFNSRAIEPYEETKRAENGDLEGFGGQA